VSENSGDRGGLARTIKAFLRKGEKYYVAECFEIAVVTQGRTIDETVSNLEEAVGLHLEGEDLAELGLVPDPTLLTTMEWQPQLYGSNRTRINADAR